MAVAAYPHWHLVRAIAALTAAAPLNMDLLMADLELDYEDLCDVLDRASYILGLEYGPPESLPTLH